jgi:hypothetical protein
VGAWVSAERIASIFQVAYEQEAPLYLQNIYNHVPSYVVES